MAEFNIRSQDFSAVVINLKDRTDRLKLFRESVASDAIASGISIVEFEAIQEPSFGALGCTKSHCSVISNYLTFGTSPYLIVLEDDYTILRSFGHLPDALKSLVSQVSHFDVFLLGGTYPKLIPTADQQFLRVFESQSTVGYVVCRHYAPKLLNCFSATIPIMEQFAKATNRLQIVRDLAADQVWKNLQRSDRWFIGSPTFGMQSPSFSDIEQKHVDYRKVSWQ